MTSGNLTEYSVSIGDEFLSQIRRRAGKKGVVAETPASNDVQNFTIRYSVPPDLLKKDNCALNLRKTTRGDFLVEDTAGTADNTLGTGQEEGSTASARPGPSFRGPGTATHDDECVLIYNEVTQKYELHLLDVNFQVSPVLKSRPRTTASANNAANATSGTSSNGILRQRPNSTAMKKQTSPIKSTRTSSVYSDTSASSQSPEEQAAKPAARRSSSTTQSMAKPAARKATPTGSTSGNTASAALLPKTSTRARLPTRRKVNPAKPKLASRQQTQSPPASPALSFAPTPSATPSNSFSESVTASPRDSFSLNPSAESTTVSSTVTSPAMDRVFDDATDQETDAGIDEAFDDLADELADELMQDEEDSKRSSSIYVGTAGGSAEDDDGVSSEEE